MLSMKFEGKCKHFSAIKTGKSTETGTVTQRINKSSL